MALSFAKIRYLDFLDLGWGEMSGSFVNGFPEHFATSGSIRLKWPGILLTKTGRQITRLVHESENQCLTGICCIKMDTTVPDSNITSIFETSEELRREYSKNKNIIKNQ
jgi:hypothetical protein